MTHEVDDVHVWLARLRRTCRDLELMPPAWQEDVTAAEDAVGPMPDELRNLYLVSNGLQCRSFAIYPVFAERDLKRTWSSLQRANAEDTAEALGGNEDLLRRFLVFADIGKGYAMFDRNDGTIWFEEMPNDVAHQTDLQFREFIELMVTNAE
jgi:hypothetical protein